MMIFKTLRLLQITKQTNTESTTKSSPPIFIKSVLDFSALCTDLIEIFGINKFIFRNKDLKRKEDLGLPRFD